MILWMFLTVFVYKSANCVENSATNVNNNTKQFIYDIYQYDTIISVTVNNATEHILDFYETTERLAGFPTRALVSVVDNVTAEHPVFVTATQQKGVSSWELPLVVVTPHSSTTFDHMARTLCPHDATSRDVSVNRPQLQISTSSPRDIALNVELIRVTDFYIEVDKEIQVTASPSTPMYYYFSFDTAPPANHTNHTLKGALSRFNYTIPKSVLLTIESDEDICALISIQNNSCPVFDNEQDVQFQGYHLTMTSKGGIVLTQEMFPRGFYVVFIVKQTDDECVLEGDGPVASDGPRLKHFRLRAAATISTHTYMVGVLALLVLVLACAALVPLVAIPTYRYTETVLVTEESVPEDTALEEDRAGPSRPPEPSIPEGDEDSLLSSIPSWQGELPPLTLAGLSRGNSCAHIRRSNRYFWSALTVSVVYALPVVQLLFTYQKMVFQIGNQDLCYYNFLCAHPLGALSDFNHVYSNIGYIILGGVFMIQVLSKGRRDRLADANRKGIPRHEGLFLSLGLALVMEGFLSASYHLCPNKMNFQFDSSFMYVMAVLCIVKLYQNRHPDVNASAHTTFMLLASLMALGVFGIAYPSIWFWAVFTVLHLAACFFLTLNIYYLGQWNLEFALLGRAYSYIIRDRWMAFRPHNAARATLLALANIANWALAAYGMYYHNKDFARHLLAVLMANTFLYTMFYVVMKLVHRERVPVYTWLYFVGAFASSIIALRWFLQSNTKWSETPAHSRRHNNECIALQFYDSHDLWHLGSALGMFLFFNVLLTVDDDLRNTPRTKIPVF